MQEGLSVRVCAHGCVCESGAYAHVHHRTHVCDTHVSTPLSHTVCEGAVCVCVHPWVGE